LSVFYQGDYNQTFSGDQRSDVVVNKFTRWDVVLKQKISDNFSVMMNINNLSDVSEGTSLENRINNWTFPNTSERYGITADLGVRFTL
jgi:hypothetical protein